MSQHPMPLRAAAAPPLATAEGGERGPGAMDLAASAVPAPAAPLAPLRDLLRGKRLLITGATGFLGKVYVSRLLAIAPEVGAIECLARPGKGKTGEERVDEEIVRSPALAAIPHAVRARAIRAIDGDASLDRFGLSVEAFAALAARIDVVVHVAGVVDFSPPLGSALAVNVYGTRGAIALAKAARAPLLHTSTCFVSGSREGAIPDAIALGDHPLRGDLDADGEVAFDPDREVEHCERVVEQCEREAKDPAVIARYAKGGRTAREARADADRHARRRIRDLGKERARSWGFPNTYTYSKGLAEQLVWKARAKGEIAATIVRPAILESALRDPEPGWNQGANTTAPLVYLIHRGHRFFPLRKDGFLDILPIDMCAGAMVAITGALLAGQADDCYQLGSGDVNPAGTRRLLELSALRYRNRVAKGQPAALALAQHRHLEAAGVSAKLYERASLPLLARLAGAAKTVLDKLAPEPRRAGAPPRGDGDGAAEAGGEGDGDGEAPFTLAGAQRAVRRLRHQVDKAEKGIRKAANLLEEYLPFTHGPRPIYATGRMRALRARLAPGDREAVQFEPESLDWRRYWLEVHLPGLERHVYPTFDAMVVKEKKPRERAGTSPAPLAPSAPSGAGPVTIASHVGDGVLAGAAPAGGAAHGGRRGHGHARAPDAPVSGGRLPPAAPDVVALLRDRVAADPHAPLLEGLPAREVLARVERGAARLAARGVGPGDRVALYADNAPAWVIGWFAIVTAGATVVPLDPTLAARDVRALCEAAWARALYASAKRRAALDQAARADGIEVACPVLALEDLAAPAGPADADALAGFRAPALASEAPATLLFTSGTTGAHKGVLLSHRALTSQVAALGELFVLGPDDVILSVLPLYHAFEQTCGMLLPLARGAHLHFVAEPVPQAIRDGLARVRPTALIAVPALLEAFLRSIKAEVGKRGATALAAFERALAWHGRFRAATGQNLGRRLFKPAHDAFGGRLSFLVSGGAALPRGTFEDLRGLGFDLYEGYGLTEAGPVVACARPGRRPRAGSVGEPIPGVAVRLDAPGEDGTGELLVRGPSVMLGYDQNDEATASALVTLPGDAGGPWLRTGDLARIDRRGRIAISGRAKDAIVDLAGNTVYPDEVEELYAAVDDVVELAVARVRLEAGKEVPGALVRLAEGADRALVLERFREVDATLPFPKRLKVVRFTDRPLPRTATRKAKRPEVTRLIEERLEAERALERAEAPRPAAAAERPGLAAARALVAEVAGLDAARLHAGSRLAEDVGLDSLQLAEVAERAGVARGGAAAAASGAAPLVELRTIDDIARRLAARAPAVASEPAAARGPDKGAAAFALPAPLKAAGNALLTFLQKRAYEGPLHAEVAGREHIPWHTHCLVVANHASHLDVGLIKHALGDYARHAASLGARDYFFKSPLQRVYFESFTEVLPVDRDDPSRERLGDVVARLQDGHTVILFPEGTRSTDGRIGRFRPGLGYLVSKARVGVLPLYLDGTHEALPKGALVPRRRGVGARIGRFLPADELVRVGEGLSRHQAYRAIAERVRHEVAALGRAAGAEVRLEPEPPAGAEAASPAGAGALIDLGALGAASGAAAEAPAASETRLARLLAGLPERYKRGGVERALSIYVKVGEGDDERWTLRLDPGALSVVPGKLAGHADCVVKCAPAVLERLLAEGELPGMEDILSGRFKTNDPDALRALVSALALGARAGAGAGA